MCQVTAVESSLKNGDIRARFGSMFYAREFSSSQAVELGREAAPIIQSSADTATPPGLSPFVSGARGCFPLHFPPCDKAAEATSCRCLHSSVLSLSKVISDKALLPHYAPLWHDSYLSASAEISWKPSLNFRLIFHTPHRYTNSQIPNYHPSTPILTAERFHPGVHLDRFVAQAHAMCPMGNALQSYVIKKNLLTHRFAEAWSNLWKCPHGWVFPN